MMKPVLDSLRSFAKRGPHSNKNLIANSILPTDFFQDSLTKLPIPKLDATLDRYLYFLEAVTTPHQLSDAKVAVEDFRVNEGPLLQKKLTDWYKSIGNTSYISEMWYDMYLRNRDALPLNLNPQLTWKLQSDPSKNKQSTAAANLIHASVRFYLSLEAKVLEPDCFHMKEHITKDPIFQQILSKFPRAISAFPMYIFSGFPLDMSQYSRLFRSTRIPGKVKDELVTYPAKDSKHIVVLYHDYIYRVRVLNDDNTPVPVEVIESIIESILMKTPKSVDSDFNELNTPISTLTGLPRTEWAETLQVLRSDPTSRASVDTVNSALFVVSLDDAKPESHADINATMLLGSARDRWFDKNFDLIICANGRSGINWEHAWGDGVAVLYYFNRVFETVSAMPSRSGTALPTVSQSPSTFEPLRFPLAPTAKAMIHSKIQGFLKHAAALHKASDIFVHQTPSMKRSDIKKSGLSPDGLLQMAMQLGHYKVHGYTPSTYESASTAAFKHGRTETIRSATPASDAFCKVFTSYTNNYFDNKFQKRSGTLSEADAQRKFAALEKAINVHKDSTMLALQGKGVDRHLFALRKLGEHGRAEIPMFHTEAHNIFTDIRMSTSTLASDALDNGGFGPVSPHSYAIGYGVEEAGSQLQIYTYKTCELFPDTKGVNAGDMAHAIDDAFKEIKEVIDIVKKKN